MLHVDAAGSERILNTGFQSFAFGVIGMKSLIWYAVGIAAVAAMISMAPDVRRYLRMVSM
jgi:hypothetical protein